MKDKRNRRTPKVFHREGGDKNTVGIINPGYGYERVSYDLNLEEFVFCRLFTIPLNRFLNKKNTFYKTTPVVIDLGVDLIHTWNSLPISRKPFVISFECELPRYLGITPHWQLNYGKKLLHSNRCRRILALSTAAKSNFEQQCREYGDMGLLNKLEVFRGGVTLPIAPKNTYSVAGPIKILFVGTDAVRKGIVPLFNACEKLIQQGLDIHLTIIGGFNEQCYVHGEHIPDVDELEALFKQSVWVNYKGRVPVDEVFKQMKLHDVLAFPTFDESLGWVPIEAGLLGVPTIATDIFAIPELIEHQETGYLISINKRADRRFIGLDTKGDELAKHISDANQAVEIGLMLAIQNLYNNREKIEQWGRAAVLKLSKMYSPESAAKQLTKIYNDALHMD